MVADDPTKLDAVIVGAGLAGLYQLHKLRDELGLTARVLESAAGVGGTWFLNRYPGLRCDIPSLTYSYSFSPELDREWTWTEKYATQPEILGYINHVADRFNLREDVALNTRVVRAVYNEDLKRWRVETEVVGKEAHRPGGNSTGEVFDTQFLIMATGCLSASKMPEVPGIESFRGATYHTAHWPAEGVDFTGQRVAVIGTGSSGIQSIPIIAQQASELTVFQRTPNFSIPAGNRSLTPNEVEDWKENHQAYREALRNTISGIFTGPPPTKSALEVTEEERNAIYQECWEKGTFYAIFGAYYDLLVNKEANDTAAAFIRAKIRSIVKDPDVAEALSPRTYPYGTKRVCVDTHYYDTFNLPNVHLVDVRNTPIVEITETGVRTGRGSNPGLAPADGKEFEVDAIVFATGFDAVTGALARIDIRGKAGVMLKSKWELRARAFLGLAVSGFPNLFTITGPLSPSVLTNMVAAIEQHVEWVTECISYVRSNGAEEIEATAEAEDEWVAHAEAVGNTTLFPAADSWYLGANVPNKPRFILPYLGGLIAYRQKCDDVARKGYEGFTLTPTRKVEDMIGENRQVVIDEPVEFEK